MAFASLCASRNSTAPHGGAFRSHFPFGKYDLVMIPGFPFGGMEHAGATFLREESVLFRSVPTAGDKIQRAALLLHETAHQWFGDLVAMRWFDDLWLRKASPCIWPTRY
jgi:aminopeptidase N